MFSSYNKINIFLFNINIFHLIQMKKALIIFGHTFGSFCHSGRSRGTVQSVSVLPGAADSRGACTAPGARRARETASVRSNRYSCQRGIAGQNPV